jgi:hypothetical protein
LVASSALDVVAAEDMSYSANGIFWNEAWAASVEFDSSFLHVT